MAYVFGDSWDCYAAAIDTIAGYWDSGAFGAVSLAAGRFSGSQSLSLGNGGNNLVKSSGVNDAAHHITLAIRDPNTLTGTNAIIYCLFSDGVTAQCSVVFRQDGAILLTSGGPTGTTLATYTGAISAQSTWFAFEIEVFISATAGYMNVRKNGNAVNDFTSATNLNTRPGANSYANKLTVGVQATPTTNWTIDDLLWRSDAASVPWVGDVRCYTRMPASDASVQFARSPASVTQLAVAGSSAAPVTSGTARYVPLVPSYTGAIGTVTMPFSTVTTCNMKCSIFASSGSGPTTVLGSATPVALSAASLGTFTFGTPVAVVKGTQYWVGFSPDASSGQFTATTSTTAGLASTTTYAGFPLASPATATDRAPIASVVIGATVSAEYVNETLQDGTTSYVYDAVAGHADFYTVAALPTAPASTVAVTTRAFVAKSDAGTRTGAVQLKSGATTVASPTLALSTSFGWTWRTDSVDPATSTAWTAAAVSAATIGPSVVA